MKSNGMTPQLAAENEDLRARLAETEETLRALASGEVDAIVVSAAGGEQVYALKGADYSYRLLVEELGDGVLMLAPDGVTILFANRSFAQMVKAETTQTFGSVVSRWLPPDIQAALPPLLEKDGADSYRVESVLTANDGTEVPVRISAKRLPLADLSGCIGLVVTDLTEVRQRQREKAEENLAAQARLQAQLVEEAKSRRRLLSILEDQKQAAEEMQISAKRHQLLFESSRDALMTVAPPSWKFTAANRATLKMFGATSVDEFTALNLWDVSPPLQPDGRPSSEKGQDMLAIAMAEGSNFFEWEHQRLDGKPFAADVMLTRMQLGDEVFLQATVRDITERRELDAQLAYAVSHDVITGLPHHVVLETLLNGKFENGSKPVWFFLIGVDRFQGINESMGHVMGDDLLRRIALRLRSTLGEAGELTRFGGDQFVAAAADLDQAAALALAERLRAAVAAPIENDVYRLFVTASIGISHSPEHGRTVPDLLRHAQAAMLQAKREGRDCCREYAVQQMREAEDRLQLGLQLRGALERGELTLHYQSQHDAGDRSLSGLEALLRWSNQKLGHVPPARFIPVAEALGLMPEIGGWVLDEACRQARVWMDCGHRDFTVAVNVAAVQLQQPGLVKQVRMALQHHAVPPEVLNIELTESALMENVARLRGKLAALQALGIKLALDDFGTGYSSLAYLKQFPIDKLKIDQSFVSGLPDDEDDATIARTIVAMAHQLHMVVVAEGVETQAQADFLQDIGCDQLQGYLFGRPVKADEAENLFPVQCPAVCQGTGVGLVRL